VTWRERRQQRRELRERVDFLCTPVLQLFILREAVATRRPKSAFVMWRAGVSSAA
jgi:hypothetical protein